MKRYFLITTLLALTCLSMAAAKLPTVSEKTLLKEITDRESLARFPSPAYRTVQFSSYDRNAVAPDRPGWYANADFSTFLRSEEKDGRVENVIVETSGPGAIVRFWMTLARGENGTVRIYIDGSDTPAIEAPAMELLSGTVVTGEPLAASVSKLSPRENRGHDLYYPIPYSKGCKVTYEKTFPDGCYYYNIECRQYTDEVNVIPFKGCSDKEIGALAAEANRILGSAPAKPAKATSLGVSATLQPGGSASYEINGSKAIEYIALTLGADDLPQAMRSTVMTIEFDSEQTVQVPLGDFFGVGYSPVYHRTFFNAVQPGGKMESFWVMPFEKDCRISFSNHGSQPVSLSGEILSKKWKWDERSMHFGSSWHQLTDHKTGVINRATPADINFVTLKGQGRYVGDAIAVFNTTGSWWGEGDEKVYVDGEDFPSHFGTGSEDYYGYAWCLPPVILDHPFLAMPIGDGDLGIGRTVNNRYRSLDAITFNESLRFDIELFEWDESRIIYAPTTFWYLKPGGECVSGSDLTLVSDKVIMTREQFIRPILSSYIEGEDMMVDSCDGEYYLQYLVSAPWSYKTCMYLHLVPERGKVVLSFESPYEAEVRADAIFCTAPDYATVNAYFNGEKVVSEKNLWSFDINQATVPMGKVKLLKGHNTFTIEFVKQGETFEQGIAALDRLAFYSM